MPAQPHDEQSEALVLEGVGEAYRDEWRRHWMAHLRNAGILALLTGGLCALRVSIGPWDAGTNPLDKPFLKDLLFGAVVIGLLFWLWRMLRKASRIIRLGPPKACDSAERSAEQFLRATLGTLFDSDEPINMLSAWVCLSSPAKQLAVDYQSFMAQWRDIQRDLRFRARVDAKSLVIPTDSAPQERFELRPVEAMKTSATVVTLRLNLFAVVTLNGSDTRYECFSFARLERIGTRWYLDKPIYQWELRTEGGRLVGSTVVVPPGDYSPQ